MPFSHQPSVAPARPRRPRDKDGHRESRSTPSSSSSGKRAKESTSRNRTPPNPLRPALPSLYTQQNLTLDQLPALPSSGSVTPSACSPVLRTNLPALPPSTTNSTIAISAFSTAQFHTPASLQPYLELEDDEPSSNTAPEPKASPTQDEQPQLVPASPEVASEPLQPRASIPFSTPSPKSAETAVFRSPSPPLSAPSPFWNQPQPGPGAFDSTQHFSQNLGFVGSPPQFAPTTPYLAGARDHYYASPPYGGPHYMAMTPSSSNIPDFQPASHSIPYYPSYGSPQQMQAPFHVMHSSSARGRSSTGSRRSFSSEPMPNEPPSLARHPEQPIQPGGFTVNNQASEDDAVDLLQRIQSAIPDLHLLLNRYKETSGQLGVRETLFRETEAHKAVALKQKETQIEKLVLESEALSNKHSAESSKLRLEIGNLEEKHKELQDHLLTEKNARKELEANNKALREGKQQVEGISKELKANMSRESAFWKETSQGYSVQQKSLEVELQRVKQECEARLQAQEAKMNENWAQERAGLQAGWLRQKRDLEDSHTRLRQDWELALDSRQKAVDDSHRKHVQDKTSWDKEREALTRDWDRERSLLGKGSEEQRKILGAQYQKEKEEMQRKWQSSQTRAHKQAEETQAKLQKEIDRLTAGWNADKSKFTKAMAELRNAAVKLNEDNLNLQKLAEAFGDVTDLKSREDPFYVEAFYHLHKQIVDLSVEHFQDTIDVIPSEVAMHIPETMPSFLSSSDGSVRLRAAYIEHVVSSILTRRIFKPFLFTLSLRDRSTDQLFQRWSDHMRSKSTRKEAFWRQRTLHAAYTVSSAKQSINKVAGIIVDEIIEAIKHFAHRTRLDQITVAVRRIVKTAAETWRYARLEIPMITASMSEEERPYFMRLKTNHEPTPADHEVPGSARQALLTLFPIIEREAIYHEMGEGSPKSDQGYTYFPGRMLYVDDPQVITSSNAVEQNIASMTREDPAARKVGVGEKASITPTGKDRSMGHIKTSSIRRSRGRGFTKLPATSPERQSDLGDPVDAKQKASLLTQMGCYPRTKSSDESQSLTPTLSQSSATSSSTGKSSSTTRPGDLPDWRSKEASVLGW